MVDGVSIRKIRELHASGKKSTCRNRPFYFVHSFDQYKDSGDTKILSIRKIALNTFILQCLIDIDLNRPGEDASAEIVTNRLTVRYDSRKHRGAILHPGEADNVVIAEEELTPQVPEFVIDHTLSLWTISRGPAIKESPRCDPHPANALIVIRGEENVGKIMCTQCETVMQPANLMRLGLETR